MKNKRYPLYEVTKVSSVSDLIKQKAGSIPDRVAFKYRKGRDNIETKTFGQVYHEVQTAACWIDQNYGRGNHIAIIGENSYEWLVAFLGTLASGNVAVPIDKELPAGEVEWLIRKAEVNAVFISKTYQDLVENLTDLKVMTLKNLQGMKGEDSENYLLYEPQSDELACIFFTSGTSGRSKGVMLTHGNLASEIYGPCCLFDPEGTSMCAVLPFHHAFGLNVAILMSYNYGVTIFLNKSLKRAKEDILLAKPQVLMLVPMFIEVFYKQIIDGIKKSGKMDKVRKGVRISNLLLKVGVDKRRTFFKEIIDNFGGELKYIISGGAHLDPFYVKAFREWGIEIRNGYGTTECSPCVAINRNYYNRDGSVGQVIEGTLVRTTEDGEIQCKGSVVMKGYYNDPEATAEVLQDGWYSTGDLGYVDKDGFLFLTGRKKNLIILSNGENISPEELENDLHLDPAVNEVLVYDKDSKIIAEIYPEEEYMGNEDYFNNLVNEVNKGRPAYKQIAKVVLRDKEFIKNSSKKIVRYKNIPQ